MKGAGRPSPSSGALAEASHGGSTLFFWPFTGAGPDFETVSDPVNLLFAGRADPRRVRAALLGLDGDRSPDFPSTFPFDRRWRDAMGRAQAAFSPASDWSGSAIQLECGDFESIRFHLRLFQLGEWTAGNAHLDFRIPGTPEHQVISWEAARRLVVFDIARSGSLAAPPARTPPIHPRRWREIPAPIHHELPAGIREFAGIPPEGATQPVPLVTDGRATILELGDATPERPGGATRETTVAFDRIMAKPFCSAGPKDYVRIEGPIRLGLEVADPPSGDFSAAFRASGHVGVTPVDPVTGEPVGRSYRAELQERHRGRIGHAGTLVESLSLQREFAPSGDATAHRIVRWRTGFEGRATFAVVEEC